jgi:hypothetical protein
MVHQSLECQLAAALQGRALLAAKHLVRGVAQVIGASLRLFRQLGEQGRADLVAALTHLHGDCGHCDVLAGGGMMYSA